MVRPWWQAARPLARDPTAPPVGRRPLPLPTDPWVDRLWDTGLWLSVAAAGVWAIGLTRYAWHRQHLELLHAYLGVAALAGIAVGCGMVSTARGGRLRWRRLQIRHTEARRRLRERHREEIRAHYAPWN